MPTNIFNYTGDVQTFIVPHGVYSIQSTLIGANGGNSIYSTGGKSIKVSADIIVIPGTVIYIYIGGKGIDSNSNIYNDTLEGGFNGGGSGGRDNKIRQIANGAGGGGATDIRIGGTKLSNRIIIAGGGGGAGFIGNGGMASEDGKQSNSDYSIGGNCGTQTSGGTVINTRGSFNGILGTGGDATFSNAHGSGGGGGGYYGGASGSSTEDHPNGYSAGGGGGSSYINKSYIKQGTDNISNDTYVTNNGSVTITYIIEPSFSELVDINKFNNSILLNETNASIITSTILNLSSNQVTITFDKNVSRKSDSSLPLTTECFNLSILGGISTLNSVTPTNLTKLDKKYILDFLLIGIPNGTEVLQVNPVYDSIYDVDGNASHTIQSNNTALLDVPKIIKVRISNNNSTISVIFNSTVYNTNQGTGILKINNFSLSIHGGIATLNNTTPTKISVSGNMYTLSIDIKGIPNGLEELIVKPSSNTSIYNKYGVPALVYQSNNSIHLYKKD